MRRRPAAFERVGLIGEQDAVGRQREVVQRRLAGQHAAPASARSRRSSGSPPVSRMLVDAERHEDVDERADLLEVEHVLARQPDVLLLRHAVLAAQVAAVGDRQAQVAQRRAPRSIVQLQVGSLMD